MHLFQIVPVECQSTQRGLRGRGVGDFSVGCDDECVKSGNVSKCISLGHVPADASPLKNPLRQLMMERPTSEREKFHVTYEFKRGTGRSIFLDTGIRKSL